MIAMQKEMHARYEVTSTIRHRGEKGRKREHGLVMFLKENLPERYGIATGEIIPSEGDEVSPQCDIIIYDRMMFPVIGKHSLVQQVPIEADYSVIEVKSHITRDTLHDAARKFEKIRAMPRCAPESGPHVGSDRDPVFLLFGYELKTTKTVCFDFVKSGKGTDTSITVLDTGCTIWIDAPNKETVPVFLTTTDVHSEIFETLGLSFAVLLGNLGSIDLGTPSYLKMMTWE